MAKIHILVLKVLILFSVFACDVHAATKNTVGVVLLHGKWGNPSQHINTLATSLKEKGYIVLTPLMPWSKSRGYDVDYPAALGIVENNGSLRNLMGSFFNTTALHYSHIQLSTVKQYSGPVTFKVMKPSSGGL